VFETIQVVASPLGSRTRATWAGSTPIHLPLYTPWDPTLPPRDLSTSIQSQNLKLRSTFSDECPQNGPKNEHTLRGYIRRKTGVSLAQDIPTETWMTGHRGRHVRFVRLIIDVASGTKHHRMSRTSIREHIPVQLMWTPIRSIRAGNPLTTPNSCKLDVSPDEAAIAAPVAQKNQMMLNPYSFKFLIFHYALTDFRRVAASQHMLPPLGPLGFEGPQHRQALRPSVDGVRSCEPHHSVPHPGNHSIGMNSKRLTGLRLSSNSTNLCRNLNRGGALRVQGLSQTRTCGFGG